MDIEEYNKLIAEFMGYIVYNKRYPKNHGIGGNQLELPKECILQKLKYHIDWIKLIEVVEKIESIYDDYHGYFGVHIYSNSCTIQGTKLRTDIENYHPAYFNEIVLNTKLESVYLACVEFIKWYNENLKNEKI